MTLYSPTDTDLTHPGILTQARFELDRAMAASGYAQLSTWAAKWGRSMLDAIEDPVVDEDELESARDDLQNAENELGACQIELEEARNELGDLETAVKAAIRALRNNTLTSDEIADELAAQL